MKKPNNLTHTKGKVLFTSAAAIALSLVAANPDKVSAATQPTNQAAKKTGNIAKKRVTKKAAIQPTTLTTENSSEAVPNDSSNEEENSLATDKNEVDSSSSDLSAAEPNDTPAKRDSAPAERTVSGQVHGLNLSYNQDTDELSIDGGSDTEVTCDSQGYALGISKWTIPSNDGTNISLAKTKKISITAKTIVSNGAVVRLFSDFSELTEITGLDQLDISEAYYSCEMFANCPKLTSLDLSSLNISKVVNMDSMFANCTSLKQINLHGFDTKKVEIMSGMFQYDSALTAIDLSGFDTANVTDMSTMFSGCSMLTNLDLSGFNTTNVTNMSRMFSECSNLKSLNLSGFNTSNVEDMSAMFDHCSSLTSLSLESFTTPKVTSAFEMFQNCEELRKLNIRNFNRTNGVFSGFLRGCNKLNTLVLGPNTSAISDMTVPSLGPDCWQKVDAANGGTTLRPKGPNYTTAELVEMYTDSSKNNNPFPDDTYVRMGKSFFVHHIDENGNAIPGISDTEFPGNYGDPGEIYGDQITGYTLKANQNTHSVTYGDTSDTFNFIYIKNPTAPTPVTPTPVQAA
ncbi:MAG: BspA family leucine-rich repeat surface protein, partial [Lactobacillus sp.]|nr:BspA family leucine-rich repeat surface protein [Lactobacillus sp.]